MTLFSIECTTCKARLKVRSADAIGQILACPRCQSMVHVAPPDDWIAPPPTGSAALSPRVESEPCAPLEPSAPSLARPAHRAWVAAGAMLTTAVALGVLLGYRGGERPVPSVALATPAIAEAHEAEPSPPSVVVEPVGVEPAVVVALQLEAATEPRVEPEPASEESPPIGAAPVESTPAARAAPIEAPLSAAEEWRRDFQLPLAAISYGDVPLERLLSLLGKLGGIELVIDREAWADDGVSPRVPASVVADNTTLDKVIERVLSEHGLAMVRDGDALRVTTAARGRPCATEFEAGSLAEATPGGMPALVGLLRKFAAPASWDVAGGFGAVAADGAKLRVVNHPQALGECDDFLHRLTDARREAAGDPATARRGALQTAWGQAAPRLAAPVSVSVGPETAAGEAVAALAQASGADLRIDRLSLEAAGLSPEEPVSLTAEGQRLAEVLTQLLAELRWGGWPSREGALILGSPAAAARREWVEFYPVGDLLAAGGGAVFMERLVAEVAPASWPSRGGRGAAYFDEASRTVIVRQTSEVHRQLEAWLAGELAGPARP